ncbi:MAG: ferritin family protein, partial [Methanobacteriota archaeon]
MNKEAMSAVKLALSLEREESDFFRLAADKTKNPSGKKVFTLLAEEEEKHIAALKKQIESVEGKNTWLSDEELFDKLVCKTLKRTDPEGIIPDSAESDTDGVEALEKAIEIEKKSIEFYEQVACDIKHD